MLSSGLFISLPLAVAAQSSLSAQCAQPGGRVDNWLYSSDIEDAKAYLNRSDIEGVQILYSWRSLEPEKGAYDFSQVEADLEYTNTIHKRLWMQIQDRSFYLPNDPVPMYVRGAEQYGNGSVLQCDGNQCDTNFVPSGWTASQWNQDLRGRFQLLVTALAEQFDGRVFGINLPETAIAVNETQFGFSPDGYVHGTLENAGFAKSAFCKTYVVQYVNFWPDENHNDHGYMSSAFEFFARRHIGVGGPDNIPFKPAQENNSYPFLSAYRDRVPISVIAVQEPDLNETNPSTGKPFTREEFTDFAAGCLGSDIIFWALSSPWLNN